MWGECAALWARSGPRGEHQTLKKKPVESLKGTLYIEQLTNINSF